jgi:methyltransferase (TIGR00027 family)
MPVKCERPLHSSVRGGLARKSLTRENTGMKHDSPSRTAQSAAMRRAAHQLLDRPPVFEDPYALRIIGPEAEVELRGADSRHSDPRSRGLRAFIAARSRFSEDALAEAAGRGLPQYVLLGAGLDTFAYRAAQTYPHLAVFEVDHPATQGWKRQRLSDAGIAVPETLTFAPVDFECETLADGLARAGFDTGQSALFAWLGVVPYLTREAIMATLRFIAGLPKGSEVIFDYGEPPQARDSALQRAALAAMRERVAAAGEPFRSFFAPDELLRDVAALGFSHVEDFDADVLNARYFSGRTDDLKLLGRGHLLLARV